MKIIFLIGVPFSQWLKLITNKNIRFSLKFIFNYLIITIVSLLNQVLCVPERLFFNIKKDRKVEDPIFVIGLWRSGTTLLHFLLGQDKYFCTPNNFQCAFPHTFNVMQKLLPLKLDLAVLYSNQKSFWQDFKLTILIFIWITYFWYI